jgi:hypothetical protein
MNPYVLSLLNPGVNEGENVILRTENKILGLTCG